VEQEERSLFRFDYRDEAADHVAGFKIIQISDIQVAPVSGYGRHVQVCQEISYVVSGHCCFFVNETPVEMSAGSLCLIHTGDVHSYQTDETEPARICNIGFEPTPDAEKTAAEIWQHVQRMHSPLVLHNMAEAGSIFSRLCREASSQREYWAYSASLLIRQLLLLLLRASASESLDAYQPQSGTAASEKLFYAMLSYIDNHIEEPFDLKDFSQLYHYSYTQLAHIFHRFSGDSLSHYYRRRRFAHAAELMCTEKCSVTETARRMGYESLHAFSKAFRKHFGLCPSQYILERRRAEEEYGLR